MKKKIISFLKLIFINLILLELALMILVKIGYLNIIVPTYQMNSAGTFLPLRSYSYGHQHIPFSTYQIKKSCLNNYFQFNSLGFRDTEHKKASNKKRVIVLGDSFMEGVGVSEDERLSNLLERETSIDHLNFGMGDKGTTQSFIIYDSIASKFEHDAVIWSLFPINDLLDDDPNYGKNQNSIRPCWDGKYPDYKLKFFPESAPKYKKEIKWKLFLKRFTYSYNTLFFLKQLVFSSSSNYTKTGYFNYSESQLNRMKFSLLKLKEKAINKKVLIVCIPSHLDLKDKGEDESIEIPLKRFCLENGLEFIGLYDEFKKSESSVLYHTCDSHWNSNGHKKVRDILLSKSQLYKGLITFP